MNIGIRQIGLVWLWMLIIISAGQSQVVFNPKIGMSTWSLKDEKEMFGQSNHPGQMSGMDFLWYKDQWLFMPGFEYHRISMQNENHAFDFNFNDAHHAHYFVIPLQAGYHIVGDTTNKLFVTGGLDLRIFYDIDDNDLGLVADNFNGVTTDLTLGIFGELFKLMTVEIEYHIGLQPALNTRDKSSWRGWTMAVGVKF